MKHHDNSRPGNDCMINEHWYRVTEPEPCAIQVTRATGYFDRGLETAVYPESSIVFDDSMPEAVREWFEKPGPQVSVGRCSICGEEHRDVPVRPVAEPFRDFTHEFDCPESGRAVLVKYHPEQ